MFLRIRIRVRVRVRLGLELGGGAASLKVADGEPACARPTNVALVAQGRRVSDDMYKANCSCLSAGSLGYSRVRASAALEG